MVATRQPLTVRLILAQALRMERMGQTLWPTEKLSAAEGQASFSLSAANLEPWSPEKPKLYDIEISVASDHLRDSICFRTIEVQGENILLNGKSVFLRGVSIHAQAPYRSGRPGASQDAETLLGWAKELGANFVRLVSAR